MRAYKETPCDCHYIKMVVLRVSECVVVCDSVCHTGESVARFVLVFAFPSLLVVSFNGIKSKASSCSSLSLSLAFIHLCAGSFSLTVPRCCSLRGTDSLKMARANTAPSKERADLRRCCSFALKACRRVGCNLPCHKE